MSHQVWIKTRYPNHWMVHDGAKNGDSDLWILWSSQVFKILTHIISWQNIFRGDGSIYMPFGKHTKSELENGPVEIVDIPIKKWLFSIVFCVFDQLPFLHGFHPKSSHVPWWKTSPMFRKKVLRRVCRFDFPMHWARNSARDMVSTMCSNGFYMVFIWVLGYGWYGTIFNG